MERQTPSAHVQPASISNVRFYFSPLADSRLQLALWECPLSRFLPVARKLPGNLATPLWAWVKWDHQARLTLSGTCLLNTSVLPFKCNMINPDSILCHSTYCLCILWDFCSVFTDSGHSYTEISRPVLPSWWVTIPRGLIPVLLLPRIPEPKDTKSLP